MEIRHNSERETIIPYLNPLVFLSMLKRKRDLIWQFAKREVSSRYKGSYMGILWSFINPLLMLLIYTFVFSVIFQVKWNQGEVTSKTEFALTLFCGLIAFTLFSEMMNKSTTLITNNQNYVKKVVFPLEVLPVSNLLSGLIHFTISLAALLIVQAFTTHSISWTIIFLPVVIIPLLFLTLALSYFLASLSVYVRDVSHTVAIIISVLFYITPIFYPIDAVPAYFRTFMNINPLTDIVTNFRKIILWGQIPDFYNLLIWTLGTFVILLLGYGWFNVTKRGFSDVI